MQNPLKCIAKTTFFLMTVVFSFLVYSTSFAQQDTTRRVVVERDPVTISAEDTIAIKTYNQRFNPRKALLYAAVVPGLGQVYNKKYWKLPLVYAGFGAVAWNIGRFNNTYKNYKVDLYNNLELGLINDNDVNPETNITTGQYRTIVNRARRERDFWVIMAGVMYILQIVDAHVDAHLKEFDLNPNLQVSIEPTLEQNALMGRQTGFSLNIKF